MKQTLPSWSMTDEEFEKAVHAMQKADNKKRRKQFKAEMSGPNWTSPAGFEINF